MDNASRSEVTLSARRIKERIESSKKKRQEELRRVRAEREENAMRRLASREGVLGGNPTTYIGTIVTTLLFLSLPLNETRIDWSIIFMLLALWGLWNLFFHRHAKMHYLLFFLLNVLVVQFSDVLGRIPELVSRVTPLTFLLIVISNFTFTFVFSKWMGPKALTRTEYFDWAASGHIVLNLFLVVATGIIPWRAFVELGRSVWFLLVRTPEHF